MTFFFPILFSTRLPLPVLMRSYCTRTMFLYLAFFLCFLLLRPGTGLLGGSTYYMPRGM
jgi:hypothetical protein